MSNWVLESILTTALLAVGATSALAASTEADFTAAYAAAEAGDPLLLQLWTKYGDVQQTLAAFRAAGRTELPTITPKNGEAEHAELG